MKQPTCALAETDGPCGPVYRGKWCRKHYARISRHGDPHTTIKRGKGVLLAELQRAARATTEECIILRAGQGRPCTRVNGKGMLASRAVWIIAHGDPGERHVLHTCHRGEEGCVNIRHLYLGDNDQNIRDMVAADRSTRGERSANAKLTAPDVLEIRRLLAARHSKAAIAERYGVTRSLIYQIDKGRIWGWLTPDEQ